jgi:hypothetical protein
VNVRDDAIRDFPEQGIGKIVAHLVDNEEFSVRETRRCFFSGTKRYQWVCRTVNDQAGSGNTT